MWLLDEEKYIWLHDEDVVGSSLPVLLHGYDVCGCSLLRWSSIWLMGADGRGSHGQQANGDSAA